MIAFGVVLALAAGGPVAAAQPDTQPLTYDGTLGLALFGGAIVSVALPAAVYKAPAGCRWCDAGNLNAIDRWARKARWDAPCRAGNLSDATLVVASAVALLPMSRESSGHDWLVNAGTVADSVAVTVMLTQAVKYTVRRERPAPTTCHPGRANEPDRNLSFFSGHSAIAFAMVASAQETSRRRGRPRNGWMWAGAGAAAATSYLRVAGDRHHLIDVVTGAGVGYAVGRWLPRHLLRPATAKSNMSGSRTTTAASPSAFAYSRLVGSDRNVLVQVGKGSGRSVQFGIRF